MSGAGRGTPRVGPTGVGVQLANTGANSLQQPVSQLFSLTFSTPDLVLTGDFLEFGSYTLPLGTLRGRIAVEYFGAGEAELLCKWGDVFDTVPGSKTLAAPQATYDSYIKVSSFKPVLNPPYPGNPIQALDVVVPPTIQNQFGGVTLIVYAREVPGAGGLLKSRYAMFDNISSIPILPNLIA